MIQSMPIKVICFLVACFLSTRSSAQDIPIPDKWETYFVWFLVSNPEYQSGSKEDESALTSAHIQYQLQLQEKNKSIAAGGLGEGPDESIVGLTILRTDTIAEAQMIAEADPAVRAGRLLSWVREWWVPAGRLP